MNMEVPTKKCFFSILISLENDFLIIIQFKTKSSLLETANMLFFFNLQFWKIFLGENETFEHDLITYELKALAMLITEMYEFRQIQLCFHRIRVQSWKIPLRLKNDFLQSFIMNTFILSCIKILRVFLYVLNGDFLLGNVKTTVQKYVCSVNMILV